MATANQMGYNEGSSYNYYEAGKRCQNMTEDMAEDCFDSIAKQVGVNSGAYGSWDMFWMGYLVNN